MNCLNSFQDFVCKCVPYDSFLQINTSLTPGATYTWVVTDKFNQRWSGSVAAETDGTLQIPIAELPNGFVSQWGGRFIITIESGCGPIKFPMAAMYEQIEIEVVGGSQEKNEIGCEVQCSGGGALNAMYPFTDASTVNVDLSTYIDYIGNNPSVQVYHVTDTPGVYNLVFVTVNQTRVNGTLTNVEVDNGGPATGYILFS